MNATPSVPVFSPRASGMDFFQGLTLPLRALAVVGRSRRLAGLAAACGVVTLVLLALLSWTLFRGTPALVGTWVPPPAGGVAKVAWDALVVVAFAILFVLGASTLPLIALAAFQDPLSAATEALVAGSGPERTAAGGLRRTAAALVHTLWRVAALLGGQLALLLLNFVPGVGSVAWAVGSVVWGAFWLAVEYLDTPMSRHGRSLAELRRLVRKRWWLCLGFGCSLYLLLWIPVLDFFLVPLAEVGGTLLYLGLRQAGSLEANEPGD